jgi:hypothetical protein
MRAEERRTRVGPARADGNETHGRLVARAQHVGQPLDGRILKQPDQRQLASELAFHLGHQPHGQERVAPQLEEIVAHADVLAARQIAPHGRQRPLNRVARRDERRRRSGTLVGRGTRLRRLIPRRARWGRKQLLKRPVGTLRNVSEEIRQFAEQGICLVVGESPAVITQVDQRPVGKHDERQRIDHRGGHVEVEHSQPEP